MKSVNVIIPALNEENSIGKVLNDIPAAMVSEVIVVDNNSHDNTSAIARDMGATVVSEIRQGYGFACLKGIEYIRSKNIKPDIVVFLDGDYADYPGEIINILKPIIEHDYDMVIGSRLIFSPDRSAMASFRVFGSKLAVFLIRLLYKAKFSDLGPFRAIKYDSLIKLRMEETTYGWTAEMQIKAARQKLRFCEVPVHYRERIGKSKISGTFKGSVLAIYCILKTIIRNLN